MPKRTSRRQILQHCEQLGPEDGVPPSELIRRASSPKVDRKALQLCRQVERTLSLVLSGEIGDDRLRDLQLLSVVPAPHSNHLLATLEAPEPLTAEELLQIDAALAAQRGVLRSAVAAAIHRRKPPDITLRVVNPSGPFEATT